MMFRFPLHIGLAAVVLTALSACDPAEVPTSGGPAGMRRLTEDQYRNSITDIFGPDILVAGRFDPIVRPEHGLLAAGTSEISVSPTGFEQIYTMANSIAAQVVDQSHRGTFVGCRPRDVKAADDDCAKAFFHHIGRFIFRRPLTDDELKARVLASGQATRLSGDFYQGLALGLGSLLSAPDFIFDVDTTEPDPNRSGRQRLTSYAKASRLSFFLWNTTPDLELMAAAERGDLHREDGLRHQIDRLLASSRVESAVRTFFADMLGFDVIADLAKDPVLYPQFVRAVKADMPEQTLRTIVNVVLTDNGDYRDLFTTRKTFMTRALGVIYQVPVPQKDGWMPYEFPQGEPRAGILTLMNFLAAFSHDGRSSPTLRGKALREHLLCQPVPIPPGNVDFALVQNTADAAHPTTRDRLTAHRSNPTCAGCHRITDPVGLGLENFDTVGVFRTTENGATIDTSGDLDGVPFQNPADLGQAMHDNPAATSCVVNRFYEYAVRRAVVKGERDWLSSLNQQFAQDGYHVPALMRRIAISDAFYSVAPESQRPTQEAKR